MYTIYIKYFRNQDGTMNTSSTETTVLTIPTSSVSGLPLLKPVVRGSEDAADSLDFSMESNSPYYDALIPMKTLMRVVYDGDTIFYGRVLTVSGSTVFQTKSVHCEGAYAFMNDTQYEGKDEKYRSKISLSEYLNKIINNHNSQISSTDPFKVINLGTVGFTPTTEVRKYEPSSWSETSSLMSSLVSEFGGHMRVVYTNGASRLNWYKYYARDLGAGSRPVVEVKKNIIDMSSETEVDDLFTKVIPVGANDNSGNTIYIDGYKYTDKNGTQHTHSGKVFPVALIRDLYTDSQLNDDYHSAADYSSAVSDYGSVYKTQSFSDAETKAELWNFTKKWVKDSYFGISTSFTITALDMHIQNQNYPKILVGDRVDVKYIIKESTQVANKTKTLVAKSVTYDLYNPENNSYTFGIPSDILNRKYSKHKSTKTSSQITSDNTPTPVSGGGDDGVITFEKIYRMIYGWDPSADDYNSEYCGTTAADSYWSNGPISGTANCYDPNETDNPVAHRELWFTATIFGKITLPGKTTKWVAVSADRGIFAYIDSGRPRPYGLCPVGYWYVKKKGLEYDAPQPTITEYFTGNVFTPENTRIIYSIATGLRISDGITNGFQAAFNAGEGISYYNGISQWLNGNEDNPTTSVIVNGTSGSTGMSIFNGVSQWFQGTGGNSELGVKVDGLSRELSTWAEQSGSNAVAFSIGAAFSAYNSGKKAFNLSCYDGILNGFKADGTTESIKIDPRSQFVKVGKTQNGDWQIFVNDTVTYTDQDGHSQTMSGFISAADFNLPTIPSFKTKIAVMDQLVAGKATIGELDAAVARIGTLETDALTANNINAKLANLNLLQVKAIATTGSGGYIDVNGVLYASNIIIGHNSSSAAPTNKTIQIYNASVSGNTLTINKTDGTNITFSKATTLSGAWSGDNTGDTATYTVTATPQGNVDASSVVLHINSNAAYITDPNGTIRARLANTPYSGVTISSIRLASNYSALTDTEVRSNIYIEAKASNGATKNDKLLTLATTTYNSGNKRCVNLKDGSSVIGRINIDATYNAGQNAVTIGNPTWASAAPHTGAYNTATFSTSAPTPKTKSLKLYLTQDTSWSNNTKKVYIREGSVSGSIYAQNTITGSHDVSGFDSTSPSGETYSSWTNNSNGYYISGSGRGATVRIVVKGVWSCNGVSCSGTNYLGGAPEAIYKNGWDNAADVVSFPSTISGSTTKSSFNLPYPTSSGSTSIKFELTKDSGGAYLKIGGSLKLRVT